MDDTINQYRIWSDELSVAAPLELPGLVNAIKANRVKGSTWLYLDHERRWAQASQLQELKMFFRSAAAPAAPEAKAAGIRPGMLRRIRLFADMSEQQLEQFVACMQVLQFKQFATVIQAGEKGDAMYLVLEGELRARNMIDNRETTLATLGVGEFFGEVSLLDHGPRSADVVANQPSTVLKISSEAVERMVRESPAVAAPFLYSLSRSIIGRMRGLTRKYQDSVHFARVSGGAS
jgi:hypothetical protein